MLVVAAGCGNKSKATIEKEISAQLSKQLGIALKIDCPKLETGDGKTSQCTGNAADGNGLPFNVTVTIKDGRYNAKPEVVIVADKTEKWVAGLYAKKGVKATVDCGKTVRPSRPDETFKCKVTDGSGKSDTLGIKIKDDQGNVVITGPAK